MQAQPAALPVANGSFHESRPTFSPAFMRFVPRVEKALRLVCMPHAGSGAAAFKTLAGSFLRDHELLVAQYRGRETRMREGFADDLHELVEEIVEALVPQLDKPYMLFGHSMGSKVAYETLLRLQALQAPLPQGLIVSCGPAPHRPSGLNSAFREDDDAFLAYLERLGGVPKELLEIPELLDMVLPILRADFSLLYRYRATANAEKIKCPLLAIGSAQDVSVSENAMQEWQELAGEGFKYTGLDGGHFYFAKQSVCLHDLLK